MNTAKAQPHQGRHAVGRHSDSMRTRKRRAPTSTRHYWDICLECPDQGNDPPNHCPPEEEVQKHNRGGVALAEVLRITSLLGSPPSFYRRIARLRSSTVSIAARVSFGKW